MSDPRLKAILTKAERWQQHYDDYCINEFGGREPSGREHDEAAAYADDALAEEEGEEE